MVHASQSLLYPCFTRSFSRPDGLQ